MRLGKRAKDGRPKKDKKDPKSDAPSREALAESPSRPRRWAVALLGGALFQAVLGLFFFRYGGEAVSKDFLAAEGGVAGPLAVFADPDASFSVEMTDAEGEPVAVEPGVIAILVLASGRKVWLLRATLRSLSRVDGLRAASVLVSLASPGHASQLDAIAEFGFACAGFPAASQERRGRDQKRNFPIFTEAAGPAQHLHRSLKFALRHFKEGTHRALLVLEEGQLFALDLLWFFVQLLPAFGRDESLWCASAVNENAYAQYVADPTVVLRSDWFSDQAWLMPLGILRRWILPDWPEDKDRWREWLRDLLQGAQRQCLFPEVPRVAKATAECLGGQRPVDSESTEELVEEPEAPRSVSCPPEEVRRQRLSALSAISGSFKVALGGSRRFEAAPYEELFMWRWPHGQGFLNSRPIASVSELQALLDYVPPGFESDAEPSFNKAPLRVVLCPGQGLEDGPLGPGDWTAVAKYFGLAEDRPRGSYRGVIRLWWRDLVLFLVVDATSPLLDAVERVHSRFGGKQTFPRLTAQHFRVHGADPSLPPHRPIPPGADVGPAPLGESCARHCENQGQVCVDADLSAVAQCAPPLTMSFACSVCDVEAQTAAFPGQHRDTGHCGAQMYAPGTKLPAGDCDALASRVRRLCVCRKSLGTESGPGGPVRLLSPGRHFARESSNTDSGAVASAERLAAFAAAVARERPATKGLALSVFALAPAQRQSPPRELLANVQNLFVLVLVSNMTTARQNLHSLKTATGVVPENVLVAHRGGASAAGIKAEFGFRSLDAGQHQSGDGKAKLGFRGFSLQRAAAAASAAKANSLLVLEEGQRFSPDLLIYQSQLLLALQRDPTLWCASAWNENSLAPYAADATVVLRTDWFAGVAWTVTLDLLAKEILPKWQEATWLQHLRSLFRDRQCLAPEVSRASPEPAPGEQLKSQSILSGIPLCSSQWVDLGNTERLAEKDYMRLFLLDWPGEGLARATPLASLRPLADGRANSKGPYRLALKGRGGEDANWKAVATFFGLLPEAPIRVTYFGVLRLRWRDSILYLINAASPFLQTQDKVPAIVAEGMRFSGQLRSSLPPLDPMLFFTLTPPFLRAPGGEVHAASASGKTCLETCLNYGLTCLDQDLLFVNHCAALGTIFKCKACEPGYVPALPGKVVDSGEDQFGQCFFSVSSTATPRCSERSGAVQRLCTCRPISAGGQGQLSLFSHAQAEPVAEALDWNASQDLPGFSNGGLQRDDGVAAADALHAQVLQQQAAPEWAASLETRPEDLAVLVVSSAGRQELLEGSLRSLSSVPGYRREQVLVFQDGPDARAQWVAQSLFKVAWVLHDRESIVDFDTRVTEHHREAISYALNKHFPRARTLLVVEEDMEAAPDMLYFFAQLEPILHKDPSLWCVSGRNELGLGPYAADLSGLLRTDVFAGSLAWMLPAELYRSELLPQWPVKNWAQHLRSPAVSRGRQCIVPEVSRARHVGRDTRQDSAGAPEARARQDAGLLVGMGEPVDLSKVLPQVGDEAFRSAMHAGVMGATVLKDLSEMPFMEGSAIIRPWQKLPGYRVDFACPTEGISPECWRMVSNFFKLPEAVPPRGFYNGVLRLRWGAKAVLFIVADKASLIGAEEARGRAPPIPAKDFHLAPPPLLAIRQNVVAGNAQDVGRSCSLLCESTGKVCHAADLIFLNDCTSLRTFFSCGRCEISTGAVLPALRAPRERREGRKGSGSACMSNSDVLQHPPSCDVADADKQRLCVCRDPLSVASQELVAVDALLPKAGEAVTVKPAALERAEATAEAAGWRPGLRKEAMHAQGLRAFGVLSAGTQAPLGHVPVLLLAAGDSAAALNATVRTMRAARGFDPSYLQIFLACCGAEAERSSQLLQAELPTAPLFVQAPAKPSLRGRSRTLMDSARETQHLREALNGALAAVNSSSLLVVHEGAELSPDALSFFSQLAPLMDQDSSIWCISAWNDAGLAPYVADLTVLLRTDWHPAKFAWMMSTKVLRQELLPSWPEAEWERVLRRNEVRLDRQCIVPEVSRCHPFGPPPSMDDPSLRRSDRTAFDDFMRPVLWNQDAEETELGELSRMTDRAYEKLFLHDWPGGEGLALSQPVESFRDLSDIETGTHHLVLDDQPSVWAKAAHFLRLPERKEKDQTIPGSYQNALRLRWRGAVLYVVLRSSKLLVATNLRAKAPGFQAVPRQPPVLHAGVASVVVSKLGDSCDAACRELEPNARCHDPDLLFLNACSALRYFMGHEACGECIAGDGQEYPSVVLFDSQLSGSAPQFEPRIRGKILFEAHTPQVGTCLWNANLAFAPRCDAAHRRLARLCACRPGGKTSLAQAADLSKPSARPILRNLFPIGQVDSTLPEQRCGAAFGNRLAADCAVNKFWCCSAGMWCGASSQHCVSPDHECRGGNSPFNFCGAGWSLRLSTFGLASLAER